MISRALATASLRPFVLAILQEGDSYGYQIIQRIHDLSTGQIEWKTGTLYPFLHTLESEGVVESYWQTVDNAPRRKYYRLTPLGEKALHQEKAQWAHINKMLIQLWGPPTELAWS